MGEVFATVHDAMAHGVNISNAFDGTDRCLSARPTDDQFDSRLRIAERRSGNFLFVPFRVKRDYGFAADSFDTAAREPPVRIARNCVQISSNDLKLH